jgi:hypothetical protein
MKQHIAIFSLIITLISACNSTSSHQAIFYDEMDYNTVKEIKTQQDQLFILGQHFVQVNANRATTSLLCLDTSLNRLWDKHFGDVRERERFESFAVTSKGDIFLAGYNEKLECAVLYKLDAKGETTWRTEYVGLNTFKNIEVYHDTTLFVVATKKSAETTSGGDSAFILKLEQDSGHISWKTACGMLDAVGYLKLANDKVIFYSNAGIYNPPFPNSKLFCLDQSGKTEWVYNLDPAATGMTNGVKALQLKADENGLIYTLCQSHDMRSMALFTFNLAGQKLNICQADLAHLADEQKASQDALLLFTGLNVDIYGKGQAQMIVKKDGQQKPYFTGTATGNQLIDFVTINNSVYKIANTGNLANHYSSWQVIKTTKK